jgi:hypothetical protein
VRKVTQGFGEMAVILRDSGVSSTPRLLDSIAGVSGILDHPLSRVMTLGMWRVRRDSIFKQPSQDKTPRSRGAMRPSCA